MTGKKLIAILFFLLFSVSVHAAETSLLDARGNGVAYIADDLTVYIWDGDPTAYLAGADGRFSIYAFNGTHLGWFIHGIVFDHSGNAVGFTKGSIGSIGVVPSMELEKGVKGEAPAKMTQAFAPAEPIPTNQISSLGLESLLRGDPQ